MTYASRYFLLVCTEDLSNAVLINTEILKDYYYGIERLELYTTNDPIIDYY